MSLPHSRLLGPDDFLAHPEPLRDVVGQCFDLARPQHQARKVEYVSALAAMQDHLVDRLALTAVDVGGDGSPFATMVQRQFHLKPVVVDPGMHSGQTLHQYLEGAPRLAHLLTCLSVLEHIPPVDLPQFLDDLATLLAPGGLLYLTADCALGVVGRPEDRYHFHWMRQQMFSVDTWLSDVITPLTRAGLRLTQPSTYQEPVVPWVYDYGFISLAMTKPRRRF